MCEPSGGANAQVWHRNLFEIIGLACRKELEELDENRIVRDVGLYLLRRIIRECRAGGQGFVARCSVSQRLPDQLRERKRGV